MCGHDDSRDINGKYTGKYYCKTHCPTGACKNTSSKYKAVWKPYSKNEEFWTEVLVGRRIVDLGFDDMHLCALMLDSGEVVKIINNEHGKGVIANED